MLWESVAGLAYCQLNHCHQCARAEHDSIWYVLYVTCTVKACAIGTLLAWGSSLLHSKGW
jgi:hypothetical protein